MPPQYIRTVFGNTEFRRPHKIDPDQSGNVGDSEPISGNERPIGELAVEHLDRFDHPRPVGLAPFGHLRLLEHGGTGMQVPEDHGDGKHQVEFDATLPHFRRAPCRGVSHAEQRRIGLNFLEIPANRDRFADAGAVVQFPEPERASPGLRSMNSGFFCTKLLRFISTLGTSMPFSARKMSTRRGFGARVEV